MDLNQAATDLYAGPREEFVARRTEAAKKARAAGDRDLAKQITELRKPTVGAWVVNRLADDPDGNLAGLLDIGARLRAAQFALDTATLRALGTERRRAVATLVRRGRSIAEEAGIAAGPGLVRDLEDTLTAAVADEAAGRAVASGRLTRTLQYSGFGDVDLEAATATPEIAGPARPPEPQAAGPTEPPTETTPSPTGPSPTTPEPAQPEPDDAARAAAERRRARQTLLEATERYGRAELEQATADARLRTARRSLAALQTELTDLIERIDLARSASDDAAAGAQRAAAELRSAEEALDRLHRNAQQR